VQYDLPEQLSTAELQDLLLVAVNLQQPLPAQHLIVHSWQHKQLLWSSSDGALDNCSSSRVQLVEQLITTALEATGRSHIM
jgi:hypothetical protein